MKVTTAIAMIANERQRQITEKGYTPEHDDEHTDGVIRKAASCYLGLGDAQGAHLYANDRRYPGVVGWPWEPEAWRPSTDPIDNLVKAGALIAAEIDRLLRAREQFAGTGGEQ